jgi:hypothetical protein
VVVAIAAAAVVWLPCDATVTGESVATSTVASTSTTTSVVDATTTTTTTTERTSIKQVVVPRGSRLDRHRLGSSVRR